MIIAVIGQKGGCGKSTIAVHLAGWRTNIGKDVLLIDSDRQGTAQHWSLTRNDEQLPTPETIQQFDRSIGRTAINFSRRFDDIIIDVAGGDELAIATSLRIADMGIVPFQPNELDVWTGGYLEDMVMPAQALNAKLRVLAVMNRAPTHHASTDVRRATEALSNLRSIEWTGNIVKERSALRRCVPAGALIDEWTHPVPTRTPSLRWTAFTSSCSTSPRAGWQCRARPRRGLAMGNPKNKPMSLRRDPGREMRDSIHNPHILTAQTQVGGKPRLIDISETGEYRKVTISMSPKLKKRLDLAVAMSDTTQVEFMISAIEPKIDDCLESFSLDD